MVNSKRFLTPKKKGGLKKKSRRNVRGGMNLEGTSREGFAGQSEQPRGRLQRSSSLSSWQQPDPSGLVNQRRHSLSTVPQFSGQSGLSANSANLREAFPPGGISPGLSAQPVSQAVANVDSFNTGGIAQGLSAQPVSQAGENVDSFNTGGIAQGPLAARQRTLSKSTFRPQTPDVSRRVSTEGASPIEPIDLSGEQLFLEWRKADTNTDGLVDAELANSKKIREYLAVDSVEKYNRIATGLGLKTSNKILFSPDDLEQVHEKAKENYQNYQQQQAAAATADAEADAAAAAEAAAEDPLAALKDKGNQVKTYEELLDYLMKIQGESENGNEKGKDINKEEFKKYFYTPGNSNLQENRTQELQTLIEKMTRVTPVITDPTEIPPMVEKLFFTLDTDKNQSLSRREIESIAKIGQTLPDPTPLFKKESSQEINVPKYHTQPDTKLVTISVTDAKRSAELIQDYNENFTEYWKHLGLTPGGEPNILTVNDKLTLNIPKWAVFKENVEPENGNLTLQPYLPIGHVLENIVKALETTQLTLTRDTPDGELVFSIGGNSEGLDKIPENYKGPDKFRTFLYSLSNHTRELSAPYEFAKTHKQLLIALKAFASKDNGVSYDTNFTDFKKGINYLQMSFSHPGEAQRLMPNKQQWGFFYDTFSCIIHLVIMYKLIHPTINFVSDTDTLLKHAYEELDHKLESCETGRSGGKVLNFYRPIKELREDKYLPNIPLTLAQRANAFEHILWAYEGPPLGGGEPEKIKQIKEVYTSIENNGDGSISQDEFTAGITKMMTEGHVTKQVIDDIIGPGNKTPDEKASIIFPLIDVDKSGTISVGEFINFFYKPLSDIQKKLDLFVEVIITLYCSYRRYMSGTSSNTATKAYKSIRGIFGYNNARGVGSRRANTNKVLSMEYNKFYKTLIRLMAGIFYPLAKERGLTGDALDLITILRNNNNQGGEAIGQLKWQQNPRLKFESSSGGVNKDVNIFEGVDGEYLKELTQSLMRTVQAAFGLSDNKSVFSNYLIPYVIACCNKFQSSAQQLTISDFYDKAVEGIPTKGIGGYGYNDSFKYYTWDIAKGIKENLVDYAQDRVDFIIARNQNNSGTPDGGKAKDSVRTIYNNQITGMGLYGLLKMDKDQDNGFESEHFLDPKGMPQNAQQVDSSLYILDNKTPSPTIFNGLSEGVCTMGKIGGSKKSKKRKLKQRAVPNLKKKQTSLKQKQNSKKTHSKKPTQKKQTPKKKQQKRKKEQKSSKKVKK